MPEERGHTEQLATVLALVNALHAGALESTRRRGVLHRRTEPANEIPWEGETFPQRSVVIDADREADARYRLSQRSGPKSSRAPGVCRFMVHSIEIKIYFHPKP